jgi:hypothetical protein
MTNKKPFMKKEDVPSIVPANTVGKQVDLEYTLALPDIEKAKAIFRSACERLLSPSRWKDLAGFASASFEIYNTGGNTEKLLAENDLIQIDIPGPGGILGEGNDWVKAEIIERDFIDGTDESLGLRLRASKNPNTVVTDTAHFFGAAATSTFIIKRTGVNINLEYYGRNEAPNIHTVSIIDNIRNGIVAAGAVTGLSNLQWQALLKGFVKEEA